MKDLKKLFPYPVTFLNGGEPRTGYPVYGGQIMDGGVLIEIKNGNGAEFITRFSKAVYENRDITSKFIKAIFCAYLLSLVCAAYPQIAPVQNFTNLFIFRKGVGI